MDKGLNIPWVGVKIPWVGGQNTMGREFDIPWIGGSIYHRQGLGIPWVFNSPFKGDQFSIRGVNIPWMKIDLEVNIPWGSKYHMTPVGSFTHPCACVGFCTSGPQLGDKRKLCIVRVGEGGSRNMSCMPRCRLIVLYMHLQ